MALSQLNERNVANSVALYLASKALAAGYLVYWHAVDSLQTLDAWYPSYSTTQATYRQNATFLALVTDSKGILTLKGRMSANPQFPVRHTTDGTIPTDEAELAIPNLAIDVGPMRTIVNEGLGTGVKWRHRHIGIYGYARTEVEQSRLCDLLGEWFDPDTVVDVIDHEGGTEQFVGSLLVRQADTDFAIVVDESEATAFEVICHVRVEYTA